MRCAALLGDGTAYRVPVPAGDGVGDDVYLDLAQAPTFGSVSGWTREQMDAVFADRGGDPDRAGKRNRFDPLLWRAARDGEPCWDDELLGAGRPGWHIECTAISLDRLGHPLDIQGGGTDLVFPHHEMSAVQSAALTHDDTFARHYVHQAMVAFEGEKMSKSRGNLVLVSKLRADGVDPMAIRLVLLDQHYRTGWEYTPDLLDAAQARLARWREALSVNRGAEAPTTHRRRARRRRRRPRHASGAGRGRRTGPSARWRVSGTTQAHPGWSRAPSTRCSASGSERVSGRRAALWQWRAGPMSTAGHATERSLRSVRVAAS